MRVKLPRNKKESIDNGISVYNKPQYVYIPLVNGSDTNISLIVKKGEYVYKGTVLGHRKSPFKLPIHSSVSGTVVDFEFHYYLNGQKVRCVKIANDYKEESMEKEQKKRKINNYTKEQFIDILKNNGIIGMGGSGFPTYVKYDTQKKINTLVVNAVECEPYITADHALLFHCCEEVLETIDAILEINNIDQAVLAIKKDNNDLAKRINSYIGTYLKIKLVEVHDVYPMGWERQLVKDTLGVNYQNYPLDKGIIVNNVSTIYSIYEALKYNRVVTERLITITGDMVKKPQNVIVKVGTPIKEVISSVGGYNEEEKVNFIAGGPMMGLTLENDDLVMSANLNCVVVNKNLDNDPTTQCLRCGKCVEVCPAKISPVLICEHNDDKKRLKELEPNRCMECGLCSYICPARIKLRNIVINAKNAIKEDKEKGA